MPVVRTANCEFGEIFAESGGLFFGRNEVSEKKIRRLV
jgi:hypothetical protein